MSYTWFGWSKYSITHTTLKMMEMQSSVGYIVGKCGFWITQNWTQILASSVLALWLVTSCLQNVVPSITNGSYTTSFQDERHNIYSSADNLWLGNKWSLFSTESCLSPASLFTLPTRLSPECNCSIEPQAKNIHSLSLISLSIPSTTC